MEVGRYLFRAGPMGVIVVVAMLAMLAASASATRAQETTEEVLAAHCLSGMAAGSDGSTAVTQNQLYAQTFVARETADLSRIAVAVGDFTQGTRNAATLSTEIRAVDQDGTPTQEVLASTTIGRDAIPEEAFGEASGSFAGFPVAAGRKYALVLTALPFDQTADSAGVTVKWAGNSHGPCEDGAAYMDQRNPPGTGTTGPGFGPASGIHGNLDLFFSAYGTPPTAPVVTATTPGGTGVKRDVPLTATFSKVMDKDTIDGSTFKLYKITSTGKKQVNNATVGLSPDGLVATLDPFGASTTVLAKNAKYKATVTTGAMDAAGNALDQSPAKAGGQQKAWTFTTGRR